MPTLEVSYHRTVNLGNYNNVHLGGKIVAEDLGIQDYASVQSELKTEVDKLADRIADEAKLAVRK